MKSYRVNVLIACEESQRECEAFRVRGFNAFSCDVQPCGGKHPEWHIKGDVSPFLAGRSCFVTQDGKRHRLKKWHLIIAHPPCTYLCKVSAVCLVRHGVVDQQRLALMEQARVFFFKCLNANADYVAVENPRPMRRAQLPPPSARASPHNYGNKYSKETYYWLINLPPLIWGAQNTNKPKCFVTASRGKYRSRTFRELAEAIATQWGDFVLADLNRMKK